jgi:hypothetical protein
VKTKDQNHTGISTIAATEYALCEMKALLDAKSGDIQQSTSESRLPCPFECESVMLFACADKALINAEQAVQISANGGGGSSSSSSGSSSHR